MADDAVDKEQHLVGTRFACNQGQCIAADTTYTTKLSYFRAANSNEVASNQSSANTVELSNPALQGRRQMKQLVSQTTKRRAKPMVREPADSVLQWLTNLCTKRLDVTISCILLRNCSAEQMVVSTFYQKSCHVTVKPYKLPSSVGTREPLHVSGQPFETIELARPTSSLSECCAENSFGAKSRRSHIKLPVSTKASNMCFSNKSHHFQGKSCSCQQIFASFHVDKTVKFGFFNNTRRAPHPAIFCHNKSCHEHNGNHCPILHPSHDADEALPLYLTVALHPSVSVIYSKKVMPSSASLQILDASSHTIECRKVLGPPISQPFISANETKQPVGITTNCIEIMFAIRTHTVVYPSPSFIPANVKRVLLLGAKSFVPLTHEKLTLEGALPLLLDTVGVWTDLNRLFQSCRSKFTSYSCGLFSSPIVNIPYWLQPLDTLSTSTFTVVTGQIAQHYSGAFGRSSSDRLIAALPTQPSVAHLGDPETMAHRQINILDQQPLQPPEPRADYSIFTCEYFQLYRLMLGVLVAIHHGTSCYFMHFDSTASPQFFVWTSTHRRRQVPVCPRTTLTSSPPPSKRIIFTSHFDSLCRVTGQTLILGVKRRLLRCKMNRFSFITLADKLHRRQPLSDPASTT